MQDLRQEEHKDTQGVKANVYSDVYRVLLVGMFLTSGLFAVGVFRALLLHEQFPLTEQWVRRHSGFATVLHGLTRLDPTSLMVLATVLLILTPVVRVVVSIYAFWVDHDRRYVLVTSIVLAIMVLTFIFSRLGLQ